MFQMRGSGTVTMLWYLKSQRILWGAPFVEAGVALEGSSTFSLRWMRVKGMLCLSWGLLFLVSCWMGSAMSATETHSSSHIRLQKQPWNVLYSFPWGLCACFCLFFSRKEKAFPRGEATCAFRNGFSSLIPWISISPSAHGKLLAVPHSLALCREHSQFQQLLCCWVQVYPSTWSKLTWLLQFSGSRKCCCGN